MALSIYIFGFLTLLSFDVQAFPKIKIGDKLVDPVQCPEIACNLCPDGTFGKFDERGCPTCDCEDSGTTKVGNLAIHPLLCQDIACQFCEDGSYPVLDARGCWSSCECTSL